ncbi:50S ribosomal protein L13 [Stappia aggregata IAM 12614]|uniref:50S ribosomal protein L13 n=1 Tax=Roseibium aggregatum (strain ATCC 25650 / DSM 13394 / JCM 20685 / NBRC 16684 / NCIMB 2208 / IAM 12614 / B1) TaxID=384765 RepID=A0NU24_ROSAI|nr:50S ribosomal protein L13 [Stappia aggregata IAM 12614] [Roseibium aggregatum IAM 12614]
MPILTTIRLQFEGKLTQEDATCLELRDLDVPKHTKLCGIMIPFF